MNIDLHTHAKWSKSAPFSYEYYQEMMRAARRRGLDAVALTEHFDTRRFADIFGCLDRQGLYDGHGYRMEGVRVFPGVEVDVAEGGHILLIGAKEAIADIRAALDGHTAAGSHIALERLLDLSEPYGCLRIGAHPYREQNPLFAVPAELLARLDAFDLNARDLHRYGRTMERRVRELAERVGVPVVAGSDTHHPLQFGSVFNRLERDCGTVPQLREAVRQGACVCRISPRLDAMVSAAEAAQAVRKRNEASAPGGIGVPFSSLSASNKTK